MLFRSPPVSGGVFERRGLRLDGDAALALDIHRIQDLRFHFAIGKAATEMDDTVGQGGFAVVDMSDNGKITDVLHNLRQ